MRIARGQRARRGEAWRQLLGFRVRALGGVIQRENGG
jgi:hypothetical protein